MVEVGVPVWTEGHFKRRSALDDLGLESVGATLLRRLIPGVVQATPNAGYYAFYPYLLAKWEERSEAIARKDFKPFYRRQEAAYAVASVLHDHRGSVVGIQGSNRANEAVNSSGDTIHLRRLAENYMDSPYGGYGLFYARVLEDMRLTRAGAQNLVDRVTDSGQTIADAFAQSFEDTSYYREFFEADEVPRTVLEELGQRTCSCTIPGRADHQPLLDIFFGPPEEDAVWAARKKTRVESLSIFLDYHRQRPASETSDRRSFRSLLAQGAFIDGEALATPFSERFNSWRAYQLRECETLLLTALWSWYLRRLEQLEPISHDVLRDDLVSSADWGGVGFDPSMTLGEARASSRSSLPSGASIVAASYATVEDADEPSRPVALALRALLALAEESASDAPGFTELRDEGGRGRWSMEYLRDWLDLRTAEQLAGVLGDLFDELHYQHIRVALPKISPTDSRDPFCFAEDEGVLRLLRPDEPFWTSARYEVVNHLMWTLGLLTEPDGEIRPTELGERILREAYVYATK